MSASGREVAYRLFAGEYDDATYSYSESDEERAPNYVVTPTGARVNRLFFVGVLTEVERVSEDVLRARVADPTGAFVVYAGQYQPDEMAFLEDAEPPMFVAITGKARTFSPDDSDRVFTSVRPESINEVDADTRDRWTVDAAEATLARVATFTAALDTGLTGDRLSDALLEGGAPEGLAAGIPVSLEQYGTTEHYLAAMVDVALEALELVAGTADEVRTPSITPGDAGDGTVDAAALASVDGAVVDFDVPAPAESAEVAASTESIESAESAESAGPAASVGETAGESPEPDDSVTSAPDADSPATRGDADGSRATTDQPESSDDESGADASSDTGEDAADDLGDFEPGGGTGDEEVPDDTAAEAPAETPDESTDDVLDEDERERIEDEYGTDFSTGTEVGDPGEADIEPEAGPIEPEGAGTGEPAPPDSDETGADEAAPSDEASAVEDEAATTDAPSEPAETTTDGERADSESATEADDVDLEAAALDAMAELDDGDGADREAVVASVVDEHGVDPGDVEDAIQDALMAGTCYEPDDETVKPI